MTPPASLASRLPQLPLWLLAACLPFTTAGFCLPFQNPNPLPSEAPRCLPSFDVSSLEVDAGLATPGKLTVELGSADDGGGNFVPWQSGATVPLVHGAQGGSMVATYLRVSDHAIGCAELHVELYIDQADGGAGDGGGGTAVPVAMEEGGFTIKSEGTTAALLIRIDGLSPTYQVSGLRLRARATVDGPGSHGTTSLLIVTGS